MKAWLPTFARVTVSLSFHNAGRLLIKVKYKMFLPSPLFTKACLHGLHILIYSSRDMRITRQPSSSSSSQSDSQGSSLDFGSSSLGLMVLWLRRVSLKDNFLGEGFQMGSV